MDIRDRLSRPAAMIGTKIIFNRSTEIERRGMSGPPGAVDPNVMNDPFTTPDDMKESFMTWQRRRARSAEVPMAHSGPPSPRPIPVHRGPLCDIRDLAHRPGNPPQAGQRGGRSEVNDPFTSPDDMNDSFLTWDRRRLGSAKTPNGPFRTTDTAAKGLE
ncbi:hypothetical protein [Amycolatopsis sp. NPDC098790]|uniref:hypothetical protein n=1 Tax=Amycolatopsis sp. NPDC098790 TaxID=3363939 RepID=UPI0037FD640A